MLTQLWVYNNWHKHARLDKHLLMLSGYSIHARTYSNDLKKTGTQTKVLRTLEWAQIDGNENLGTL